MEFTTGRESHLPKLYLQFYPEIYYNSGHPEAITALHDALAYFGDHPTSGSAHVTQVAAENCKRYLESIQTDLTAEAAAEATHLISFCEALPERLEASLYSES